MAGLRELRDRVDAERPDVILESELTLPIEWISDHHVSRAQWFSGNELSCGE